MGWYETGEVEIPLYRFILVGYMVSEQGTVIAYRFGLLHVVRNKSNSTGIGTGLANIVLMRFFGSTIA